jgi:hypothetical protein
VLARASSWTVPDGAADHPHTAAARQAAMLQQQQQEAEQAGAAAAAVKAGAAAVNMPVSVTYKNSRLPSYIPAHGLTAATKRAPTYGTADSRAFKQRLFSDKSSSSTLTKSGFVSPTTAMIAGLHKTASCSSITGHHTLSATAARVGSNNGRGSSINGIIGSQIRPSSNSGKLLPSSSNRAGSSSGRSSPSLAYSSGAKPISSSTRRASNTMSPANGNIRHGSSSGRPGSPTTRGTRPGSSSGKTTATRRVSEHRCSTNATSMGHAAAEGYAAVQSITPSGTTGARGSGNGSSIMPLLPALKTAAYSPAGSSRSPMKHDLSYKLHTVPHAGSVGSAGPTAMAVYSQLFCSPSDVN